MTTQAKQQQGQRPMDIKAMLEAMKDRLREVMPKHLTPERLIKVSLAIIHRTPKLQRATAQSLLQAIVQAAELGLEPGSALGHCYLVPYEKRTGTIEVQLQIGYRGYIELALRGGRVVSIDADIIHEKDTYSVKRGTDAAIKHIPFLAADPGKMVAAYAVATLSNGARVFTVMRADEIDRIRARSKSGQDGPWVTDFEEMAKKTPIRRLAKYLPLSTELARALEVEEEGETVEGEASTLAQAALPAMTQVAQDLGTATSRAKEKVRAKSSIPIVDVQDGETEEEAAMRTAAGEPPDDLPLPTPTGMQVAAADASTPY
jgi:recombination protein RecT